jgi:hypothetical protein
MHDGKVVHRAQDSTLSVRTRSLQQRNRSFVGPASQVNRSLLSKALSNASAKSGVSALTLNPTAPIFNPVIASPCRQEIETYLHSFDFYSQKPTMLRAEQLLI